MTNSEGMVQVVRGYSARSHQIILTSVKSMLPTTEAEEDEIESSYACIPEEFDHTPKQNMLIIIDDWNAKAGN